MQPARFQETATAVTASWQPEEADSSRARGNSRAVDTRGETVGQSTADQRRALEGKRPLSKSYIARHWRGELSLPRSYWINGLLLNIGFQFAIGIIGVIYDVVHSNVWAGLACAIAVLVIRFFWFFIVGPWQLIGLWRSATYYFGWPVWSGIVKLLVIIGWFAYLFSIVTTVNKFLPK